MVARSPCPGAEPGRSHGGRSGGIFRTVCFQLIISLRDAEIIHFVQNGGAENARPENATPVIHVARKRVADFCVNTAHIALEANSAALRYVLWSSRQSNVSSFHTSAGRV